MLQLEASPGLLSSLHSREALGSPEETTVQRKAGLTVKGCVFGCVWPVVGLPPAEERNGGKVTLYQKGQYVH